MRMFRTVGSTSGFPIFCGGSSGFASNVGGASLETANQQSNSKDKVAICSRKVRHGFRVVPRNRVTELIELGSSITG